MTKFKFGMTWLSVLLLAFTVGCGGGEDTTTQGPGDGTGETVSGEGGDSDVSLGDEGSTDGSMASGTVPETPLEAAKFMMYGLADGRPQDFYKSLPPSYQSDIDTVISKFAGKVDADVYDKTFALLQKATGVLKNQKENILALIPNEGPAGPAPVDMAEVKANYDNVVSVLATLVDSDFSTVEKLKTLKGEALMSGTAAKLMKQVMDISASTQADPVGKELADIKKAKVSLVSEDGDKAVIKVEHPDSDKETKEETWVKVEGRWIPEEIATDFKSNIEEAIKGIDEFEGFPPPMKEQIITNIGALDDILTRMDDAASKEELRGIAMEAAGAITGMVAPLMGGGMGPGPGGPGPGGPGFGPDTEPKPETEEKIEVEVETEVKPEVKEPEAVKE